ncbi:MAG TPA: LysM peptidoglycan-binding domain-containing protein [Bacilli bacterium]
MKLHIVKKGDTLFQIAEKYHVDLETLLSANPQIADPDEIAPGMKIKIPHGAAPVAPPDESVAYKHIVQQGDTLWKLSKAWNVPLQSLIAFNPHLKNPNVLLTGETVFIPKSGAESPHQSQQSIAPQMQGEPPQSAEQSALDTDLGNIHGAMDLSVSNQDVNVAQVPESGQPFVFADESDLGNMSKKIDDLFAQFKVPATEASSAIHPEKKAAAQMLPPAYPSAPLFVSPQYMPGNDCGCKHPAAQQPFYHPYAQPAAQLTAPTGYPTMQAPYAALHMPPYAQPFPVSYMAYAADPQVNIYQYPMPWTAGSDMSTAPHGTVPLQLPDNAVDSKKDADKPDVHASAQRHASKQHRNRKSSKTRGKHANGKSTGGDIGQKNLLYDEPFAKTSLPWINT